MKNSVERRISKPEESTESIQSEGERSNEENEQSLRNHIIIKYINTCEKESQKKKRKGK